MGEMDRGAQFSVSKGGEMETGMKKWKKGKEEGKKKKNTMLLLPRPFSTKAKSRCFRRRISGVFGN